MTILYDPITGHISDVMRKAVEMAAISGSIVTLKFNGREYEIYPSHYAQMMQLYRERTGSHESVEIIEATRPD